MTWQGQHFRVLRVWDAENFSDRNARKDLTTLRWALYLGPVRAVELQA